MIEFLQFFFTPTSKCIYIPIKYIYSSTKRRKISFRRFNTLLNGRDQARQLEHLYNCKNLILLKNEQRAGIFSGESGQMLCIKNVFMSTIRFSSWQKSFTAGCALLSLNADWIDGGGSLSPSLLQSLVYEPLIRFPACSSEYRFAVRRRARRRSWTHLLQKLRYPVTITTKQRATEKPLPPFQLQTSGFAVALTFFREHTRNQRRRRVSPHRGEEYADSRDFRVKIGGWSETAERK